MCMKATGNLQMNILIRVKNKWNILRSIYLLALLKFSLKYGPRIAFWGTKELQHIFLITFPGALPLHPAGGCTQAPALETELYCQIASRGFTRGHGALASLVLKGNFKCCGLRGLCP